MSWVGAGATVAGAVVSSQMGGSGSQPARTTRSLPDWAQGPAKQTLARGVGAGRGMEFIPLSPEQQQSLGQMESFASGMDTSSLFPGQTVGAGADLMRQTVEGDFLSPSTNPELQATIDAATGQVIDDFEQRILPQLGSSAQRAGAWGGSRQGLMEARAADEVTQNIGELRSRMLANAYSAERGRQQQAMQMLPTVAEAEANMGLMPSQILGQVGEVRRQEEQGQNQFPFRRESMIGDFIAGLTRGQGTMTEQRAQPSSFVQGMQGALGGAQLYNTASEAFGGWGNNGNPNQQSLFNNNLRSGRGSGAGGMAF